jgi:carbon monoxide dehydrogenase subunit G
MRPLVESALEAQPADARPAGASALALTTSIRSTTCGSAAPSARWRVGERALRALRRRHAEVAHTAKIAAPAERVWQVVADARLRTLVPGVAAVTPAGPDRFKGSLLVQIGPVRLVLDGDIAVVSRDDGARKASLRADAKDTRLGGTVRATVDIALRELADGCELSIASDVQIGGRIGAVRAAGDPARWADQLLAQFAQCPRSAG